MAEPPGAPGARAGHRVTRTAARLEEPHDDEPVDLDLHCVPDRDHCERDDDAHLDAVHLGDARP